MGLSGSCFALAAEGGIVVGPPAPAPKDDKKDEKKDGDKPKGPSHNVTLAEESGVLDLLNRAQKARARAEKEPQVWPECVKHYADILRKYPNTVFLERWEGPDGKDGAYKNGLYRSTRERVAQDIASLPEKGLATYQLINDPDARSLYNAGLEQFNERKMEQVALDYFCTSFGDDALLWLSEVAYNRGAPRQAVTRLGQLSRHPNADVPQAAVLVRQILAQLQTNDRNAAEKTLAAIAALNADAQKLLRVGHEAGAAAIEKLKKRVENAKTSSPAAQKALASRGWETYFGNAAHNRVIPNRSSVGVLKWSVPIVQLLYGPQQEVTKGPQEAVDPNSGQNVVVPETQNQHLTIGDGFFYLCDSQLVAAYPVGNPKPGAGGNGNAKFLWPSDIESPKVVRNARVRFNRGNQFASVRHQPYFATLGGDRLFVVLGPEPPMTDPNMMMWGGQQDQKAKPNSIIALGATSGSLKWSLQPEQDGFQRQSKADQEWLKGISFICAPTYDSGVLYASAMVVGGSNESWVAAFDADNGQMLWRTMICSSSPAVVQGPVQPALSLPPTVSGGNVFVCTNLGAVAALEASTGGVKWIRVYDRTTNQVNRFNAWNNQGQESKFWGPNPPIVWENLLIVTPQDSDILYAYYIETDPNSEGRIVGGRRAWQIPRSDASSGGTDLKHVLGISNGHIFLSGTNLAYYEVKSGKKAGPKEPFQFDSPIKGRGVVTENMILLPTEKGLVRLDIGQDEGRLSVKIKDQTKWTNPAEEAGNIFVAGDVLYTTSHTHVNAYFVWEEMEARLRDRIKKQPSDGGAYIELIDVYQRVGMEPKALATIEEGLAGVAAVKETPQGAADMAALLSRKFDVLFAVGEKSRSPGAPNLDEAYASFKKALDVAKSPALNRADLPVTALRCMAEVLAAKNNLAGAAAHYQEIIEQYGDVVYTLQRATSKARLFAQAQIEELRRKDPKCYDAINERAKDAFAKAGDKTDALEAVLSQYPNSDVCGPVLLKLAQVSLDAAPDQSRNYAQRFLRNYSSSPEAPQATAILAVTFEKLKAPGLAKDMLRRLATRKEFADKTIAFDPLQPKARPAAPIKVSEWAATRLKDPIYVKTPSAAQWSLGSGKLKQAWTKPVTVQSMALQMSGQIPAQMRNCVFYVENQELVVISGTERGDEVWTPRPKLPAGGGVRAVWAENLLIMSGEKEIVAYDSAEKGKVAWRKNHLTGAIPMPNGGLQGIEQRLVLTYPTGLLGVLDSSTGGELWRVQVEGNAISYPPACGEGFVAVFGGAPPKITLYNIDTGALRSTSELPNGLALAPMAVGDRLYCADRSNMLRAYDGLNGKLLWEQQLDGPPSNLRGTRELLVAVIGGRSVKAISPEPAAERRIIWEPALPGGVTVRDVFVDAEDLYVTTAAQGGTVKSQVISYSIKAEGKYQWPVEISHEHMSSILLSESSLAAGHLLMTQSNWDPTGAKPSSVVLVDRRTGKLVWDEGLSTEVRPWVAPDGTPQPSFNVQLFDGGLVLTEGKRRVAFSAMEAGAQAADPAALLARLEQNKGDVELRVKTANALAEKGDREKAIATLLAGIAEPNLVNEKFSTLYDELARLRKEHAKKSRLSLPFMKVAKAPALDGSMNDWGPIPEKLFESWKDVILANEEEGRTGGKTALWKGASDLKVSFRGAYDDKNLYVMLVVTDDVQKNEQTDPIQCDLGDSARLVFDMERDGGLGWRGEDFMLGAALMKENKLVGWRWVESGRYLRGDTALKTPFSVTRKDAEKQTVYQFSLPLEYLKLTAENGRKFGFSFIVNDQDEAAVEKSMAASPGVTRPPNPGLFAEGVLQEK
ncbi:MAG TPA: PQQ-binding-like beta-propeller repeat protein [Planctomycetota bacterium]|nr:PQQ-binding-like beta-propeller repeat protein [Planctomycetota bacterium]